MTVLLDVEEAKVHFGGVRAVDGVSFKLETGMLYGLVGPNGSGKSTLLGALSRMTNMTGGRLVFGGREYQGGPVPEVTRMGISRTFQAVRLLPERTVLENVMLGADARIYGRSILASWLMPWRTHRQERDCRADALAAIERLELAGMEKRQVGFLPYGTQRRVEIARALAARPTLLLLDEPTAGMNRQERDEIGAIMRDLRSEGLTQVLVEHDMQMITDVCDYVFVMNFGKLIAEGAPEMVVTDPVVQEAYLGKRGEEEMPLLEVEDLHVRYGGVTAVDGVRVSVEAGQVEAVLGANGAGKTSTLRAVAGQVRQSSGTIRWDGTDISRWPSFKVARAGLVLVPEGRRVFGPLNVFENLLLGGYTNRSKTRRDEVLEQVFAMFPVLHQRRRQAAGLLSGGEQQMLAFGRAMMAEPRVILLDEPSMGLSPLMVDVIMESIARIAATGIGVLMVEQNAMAALRVAQRATVLERGQIVLTGSADEVRSHPDVVKAFLGDRAAA